MKYCITIILNIVLPVFLVAQTTNTKQLATQADCKLATTISVYKSFKYGPVMAPDGFGQVQEITSNNNQSTSAFAKEHNSAWYILKCAKDADLNFKIIPIDASNDYDFLLYKITDSLYCNNIKSKKLLPVRGNLSRVNLSNKGITGLDVSAKNEFSKAGPGIQFSKQITIKKGEQYLLVIDNVYDNGKGFFIDFELTTIKEIKGEVINENNEPIVAEVSLSDNTGNIIASTKSDKQGHYVIKTVLDESKTYQLTIVNDKSFFETLPIYPKVKPVLLKTQLQTLKIGNKYKVGQINFLPNSDVPLTNAQVSINNLVELMKRNPKLEIIIEGHVNGVDARGLLEVEETERHNKLSVARAEKIAGYLTEAGIHSTRFSTIGYGSNQMLFPKAVTDKEQSANRRVEVKITALNED